MSYYLKTNIMKLNLSILALFMGIYAFSQNQLEVSAESTIFPPKEVFIDCNVLTSEDKYEIVKDWINANFNIDNTLVREQECDNFITLVSTVEDLYEDYDYLIHSNRDVKYELAIQCLDNKISIKIKDFKVHFPETYTSGGWENVSINYDDLYRKNGKLNMKKKETLEKLQNHLEKVVFELENHIKSSNNSVTLANNK